MLNNIVAVVSGVAVGMVLNMALIRLNFSVLFPVPEGLDTSDIEQFNGFLQTLPDAAFLVVFVAHLSQSFAGAWVAARIAHEYPMRLALVVGLVAMAGGFMAMRMLYGPEWLIIELPLYVATAWLGGQLELRRRAREGN